MKYVIVLFTRFDDWKRDNEGSTARNHGFDGFIESLTEYPKAFLRKCKNRYIAFDNTLNADDAGKQVQELIEMIDTTLNENGTHYTSDDYLKAEKVLQQEIHESKKQKEQEILELQSKIKKETNEELRKEYDARETKLKESIDRIRPITQQESESWLEGVVNAGLKLVAKLFKF